MSNSGKISDKKDKQISNPQNPTFKRKSVQECVGENKVLKIPQHSLTAKQLPLDAWKKILEASDVWSQINFFAVSQSFKKIGEMLKKIYFQELKELEAFSRTQQWTFKNECAMRILMFVARLYSDDRLPTIEEFKVGSTVNKKTLDVKLTPAEALQQVKTIKDNYQTIQSVYNQLLGKLISNIGNWLIRPFLVFIAISISIIVILKGMTTLEDIMLIPGSAAEYDPNTEDIKDSIFAAGFIIELMILRVIYGSTGIFSFPRATIAEIATEIKVKLKKLAVTINT